MLGNYKHLFERDVVFNNTLVYIQQEKLLKAPIMNIVHKQKPEGDGLPTKSQVY